MTHETRKELPRFLEKEWKQIHVVVMPDFFLDRFVSLDWNAETLCSKFEGKKERKGGSIDEINQTEIRGGNAANTASALAALNVKVTPIMCTDKLGLKIMRVYLSSSNIDLAHVKTFDRASLTTALEFPSGKEKINVMLRDVGSLTDFGPQHLDEDDFKTIEKSDYVCVFNWAGTKRNGTDLAKTVFHYAKMKKRAATYYDTADPTPNKEKIPELVKNVLQSKDLDIMSLNENEAVWYASLFDHGIRKLTRRLPLERVAKESARVLATHLMARIDLHTTSFSGSFTKKGETIVPAFDVSALRATGAGDAWNAGNIVGDAGGLSDESRLMLANAVAACYISDSEGKHPTRKQLIRFLKTKKLKHINK